jgi:hypothetical protein
MTIYMENVLAFSLRFEELENLWVLWLFKTLALLNSKSENIIFGLFQK